MATRAKFLWKRIPAATKQEGELPRVWAVGKGMWLVGWWVWWSVIDGWVHGCPCGIKSIVLGLFFALIADMKNLSPPNWPVSDLELAFVVINKRRVELGRTAVVSPQV